MSAPVAHRCCVTGCGEYASRGAYIPESPQRGTWWACDDHEDVARARRDAARGTLPKAPAAVDAVQGSLFGGMP